MNFFIKNEEIIKLPKYPMGRRSVGYPEKTPKRPNTERKWWRGDDDYNHGDNPL